MKFTYKGETLDSELLMFSEKQRAYVDLLEEKLEHYKRLKVEGRLYIAPVTPDTVV